MEQQWYIAKGKQKLGPFSIEQMQALVTDGKLFKSDMVLNNNQKKWQLAETVENIFTPSKDNKPVNTLTQSPVTNKIPFSNYHKFGFLFVIVISISILILFLITNKQKVRLSAENNRPIVDKLDQPNSESSIENSKVPKVSYDNTSSSEIKKPAANNIESLSEAVNNSNLGRLSEYTLKDFVLYGNLTNRQKFFSSSTLDKAQTQNELQANRQIISKKKFFLDNLKFRPITTYLETKGLLGEIYLPFRICHFKGWLESSKSTGILNQRPHPNDARGPHFFLTKDEKLQKLNNFQEINQVRNLNGVLYVQESKFSSLILEFGCNLEESKQIARNPNDYSITIEFQNLSYERPSTWGFYKEEALLTHNYDCEMIREFWPPPLETNQPDYFVIGTEIDNKERIPEIIMAQLLSLSIYDKNMQIIGNYSLTK